HKAVSFIFVFVTAGTAIRFALGDNYWCTPQLAKSKEARVRISNLKSRGDPMTCKKCGGLSKLVMNFPESLENEGCSVYQCLDCQFVEWFSQGPMNGAF
ncbi:MAG: hypothetical protein WCF52_22945, partial [Pseudolabrys sp.]